MPGDLADGMLPAGAPEAKPRVLRYSYYWHPFGRLNAAVEKMPFLDWCVVHWYDGEAERQVIRHLESRQEAIKLLNQYLVDYGPYKDLSIDETEEPFPAGGAP